MSSTEMRVARGEVPGLPRVDTVFGHCPSPNALQVGGIKVKVEA